LPGSPPRIARHRGSLEPPGLRVIQDLGFSEVARFEATTNGRSYVVQQIQSSPFVPILEPDDAAIEKAGDDE
jgi:hypothetical protein